MPRIVIIGAGPAGLSLSQSLAKQLSPADDTEVVVFEKSKYYYHAVGTPRAYTEESFSKMLFIPYDNAIPANARSFVRIVRAVVTSISADKNEVAYRKVNDSDDELSATTETLAFDSLVIATGSTYTVPIKPDSKQFSRAYTERKLKEVRDQIAAARKILIVGGGAVGCEVAGDIASKYPDKTVTILEGRDQLVAGNNLRDKFRNNVKASLERMNVKVILGERLEERLTGNSFTKRTLRTNKGTEIESDIQLLCGGFSPAAELVREMDPAMVDNRGFVKVNALLQLDDPRYHHMFALGDVSNHATPKLAFLAGEQGKHLAKEFVSTIRKRQSTIMNAYPAVKVEACILPLGPNGGVSQLPVFGGLVLGNFITRLFKAKDMFASMTWKSLGATAPASS
ncbi:hypothetical protein P43SY_005019 [Pythium insidiosum]|uniref:FAD/NAD(P)-binding domain-containing protein n=1 Tax=Pythium insidiosum TaxID=114742 RepID=A0AAD5LNU7_PYTIN|nr:hypothetical protein P43SY_005019 [Pythium insidiosum]